MANTDSSRRHVQQLPYPWDFKVNEACSPDTSTTKVVSNEYYELTGAILGRLATMQDLSNNHPVFDEAPHEALMAYIGCIMRYANGQLPGQTPMSHILKCVTLGGSVTANFNNSTGPKHSEIRTELELAGCTGAAFMSIDFLFIPWWDGGHWRLLGCSPKQEYVFFIDPIHGANGGREQILFLKRIIFDNVTRFERPWPMLRSRSTNHRIGATQNDTSSCGVFAVTSMMCLCLGYQLDSFGQRDIPQKRRRMVAELLNGGFTAPFDYDFIEAPLRLSEVRATQRIPRSHGAMHLLATPSEKTVDKKPQPESSRIRASGELPPQFSPIDFEIEPCIYASLPEPIFTELKTKKELIDFCTIHDITGYKAYADRPGEGFRNWLENQAVANALPLNVVRAAKSWSKDKLEERNHRRATLRTTKLRADAKPFTLKKREMNKDESVI